MDQNKFINLQYQMKENNEELQDFLRDLDSWKNDIAIKDQKLKEQKPDSSKDVSQIMQQCIFTRFSYKKTQFPLIQRSMTPRV